MPDIQGARSKKKYIYIEPTIFGHGRSLVHTISLSVTLCFVVTGTREKGAKTPNFGKHLHDTTPKEAQTLSPTLALPR